MSFTDEERRAWHEAKREREKRPEIAWRPEPVRSASIAVRRSDMVKVTFQTKFRSATRATATSGLWYWSLP